jgi:hypothetical protein
MNAWEPELIELWNQGVETQEIAPRWGIKATTAQSRAHRLQLPCVRHACGPVRSASMRTGLEDVVTRYAWYAHGAHQRPGN